jgi:thymidylate synthase (FAD)
LARRQPPRKETNWSLAWLAQPSAARSSRASAHSLLALRAGPPCETRSLVAQYVRTSVGTCVYGVRQRVQHGAMSVTTTPEPAIGSDMRETAPSVHLIARPSIDVAAMRDYLDAVGGLSWLDRRQAESVDEPNAAEMLIEFCGRVCYRSWEPGLNKNVTRVRTDQHEYLGNLLSSLHGSVLEHANYTFAFRNVSRVFTHELVRHRAGSAFSQESLRYVRLTDIGFRVPPALEPIRDQVISLVEQLEEFQVSAAEALGLDDEGVPFSVKKEVTSALRRLAPIGLSTDIIWTANIRTLRHVIEMRTSPGAEEELRLVFGRVAEMMRVEAPSLFQDFSRADDGSWIPAFRKV